jgi:phosphotransferase system enzyme I (PtsI)
VVAVGEVERRPIVARPVSAGEQAQGWKRFQAARAKVRKALEKMLPSDCGDHAGGDGASNNAGATANNLHGSTVDDIFQTHLLMLTDEVFIADLRATYIKSGCNIEFILDDYVRKFSDTLRAADVALLAERAGDILDVFGRVMDELTNVTRFDFTAVPPDAILVARTVTPTDLLAAVKKGIAGIVLSEGGAASHAAIIARAYGVPAVFQVPPITALHDGCLAILDAVDGRLYVDPTDSTRAALEEKALAEARLTADYAKYAGRPCTTSDGTEIRLFANIGSTEEAVAAAKIGADGIGLFRSEFLFMQAGAALDEETQYRCYRQVLESLAGKPVVIRTLDAGGDKVIEAINTALGTTKQQALNTEKNPLLGQRAIRLSLSAIEVFTTQLRALLRAGVHGNLRILFPLVTRLEEVTGTLRLIDTIKRQLDREGVAYKKDVKLGVMIETPAAALISPTLASYCDFFSIGTNDLTQYTLAIDRENPAVARYFNEFHPAVLALIKMTVDAARAKGIDVAVCGEMAGSSQGARLLAGMGVRHLSVTPSRISALKAMFAALSDADLTNTGPSAPPAARIREAGNA